MPAALSVSEAPRPLVLPPPYSQHWLGAGEVLAEAMARAPAEGAGTLVWQHRPGAAPGRLDFAVVLEPEEPLATARRAFLAGMAALGDALATQAPPERAVRFGWPGEVIFDRARLGGARMAVPPGAAEEAVPDWLVFAVELIADRDHLAEPGAMPGSISLAEEGFEDPVALIESFAAHLMLRFDRWRHEGFASIVAECAHRYGAPLTPEGNLRRDDGISTLAEALRHAPWRDSEGPRL